MDFVCDLSAGLVAIGEHEEALTLIVNALEVQQRGGKFLYVPALLRMKGLTLASRSTEDYAEAESSLLSSIDWAKRQSASLYELKSASDLAELLLLQARAPEAYQHISAALNRTPDGAAIAGSRARPADPRPASIRRQGSELALEQRYRRRRDVPAEKYRGDATAAYLIVVGAVAYKSSQSPASPILRQRACCSRNGQQQGVDAMSKKVAEIIVETLQSAGVKHCYGVVGDTLNRVAHSISKSGIEWVGMRHEEAGAFAAQGEALLTGSLTAVAGSCGPGSLHFINGIVEANRNRAPVILIASQIVRDELGFDFPQEVDFKAIYGSCSVYCDMILTPEQARRKTVMACQTAIAKRGVAVLIVPVDISHSDVHDDVPFTVHTSHPVVRPTDADLDEIAAIINAGQQIAIYGGSGCRGAHDEILRVAEILKAPIAHTSRGKDSLEYDNPYNVGMTGLIGNEAAYHAVLKCDTLLLLGADFAWRQFYPDHAKIVQIDIEPTHLGRRHPVTRGLVGDIKATLEALIPRLHEKSDTHFRDRLRQAPPRSDRQPEREGRTEATRHHFRDLPYRTHRPDGGRRCPRYGR